VFTLQDPIAFFHRNDSLHKLRWDLNGSTDQVSLLELKSFFGTTKVQVLSRFEVRDVHLRMDMDPPKKKFTRF